MDKTENYTELDFFGNKKIGFGQYFESYFFHREGCETIFDKKQQLKGNWPHFYTSEIDECFIRSSIL